MMIIYVILLEQSSELVIFFIVASVIKLTTVQDAHMAEGHCQRHGLMQALSLGCNWLGLESNYMVMEADIDMKEGGQ